MKILLVEDDAGDAFLIREMLLDQKGIETDFSLEHVASLAAAWEYLDKGKPDAVLLDLGLPDSWGMDTLRELVRKSPDVPIVVLTGLSDEAAGLEALHEGAQDYLVKGQAEAGLLKRSIRYAIERERAEGELRKKNAELSLLYRISQKISQTIDLSKLLPDILDTVTGIEAFDIERKGLLFLMENDRLRLAHHIGHTPDFIVSHKYIGLGDCMCGLAAKSGEVVVSCNSHNDDRHTICNAGMSSHGHIIVPLKSRGNVAGVLCLNTIADAAMDREQVRMLTSIGELTGIAIENAKLYNETRELALHDALTGLSNRRSMEIVFEQIFARAKRHKHSLTVIMMDIDHFKKYNDMYGHAAGDCALAGVGAIIAREMREADFAVRYGGEEFLVILPDTETAEAREAGERIRKTVEEQSGVTISLGIASYQQGMECREALIKLADEALYSAKANGRNRIEVSD